MLCVYVRGGGGSGADPGNDGGEAKVKVCARENFTLGHAHFGVSRGMPNWEGEARRSIKSITVAHKGF